MQQHQPYVLFFSVREIDIRSKFFTGEKIRFANICIQKQTKNLYMCVHSFLAFNIEK